MKALEKKKAIQLRKLGWSINDIYKKLNVSKSSASLWVRDIKLTVDQKKELSKRGVLKETIERRRTTRLKNENARRQIIVDAAKRKIRKISIRELFLVGIGLYWAEGSKNSRGVVNFSNSDPRLIQIMVKFFKEICGVPENKLRGHVYLHPHLDSEQAKRYWHKVSAIPLKQFYKVSQQHNKASKGKKDSLPFGTFSIQVCSTTLLLQLKGWAEKMHEVVV